MSPVNCKQVIVPLIVLIEGNIFFQCSSTLKRLDTACNVNRVKRSWVVFYQKSKLKYYIISETEIEPNEYKYRESPLGEDYPFGAQKTEF